MPFFTTPLTPERLEFIVQLLGAGFAGYLVKYGIRLRKQRAVESLGLLDKNVLWAQNMMDRLGQQIDELQKRVESLERENRKLKKEIEEYRIENFLLEQKVASLENAKTQTGT